MGAEYSAVVISDPEQKMTDQQLDEEMAKIIAQAEYNHGHAGYSGSFAEKTEATIRREKMFEDEAAAEKFVMNDLDSDKWGPADIVPIKGVGWYVGGWCSS